MTKQVTQRISKNMQHAQAQQTAILDAIASRIKYHTDKGIQCSGMVELTRVQKAVRDESFVKSLALLKGALDIDRFVINAANPIKGTPEYGAGKVLEKIVKTIHAFAHRDLNKLDTFLQQPLNAALFNGNSLTMQGMLASLSKRIAYHQGSEIINSRADYSPQTASAQSSQVRETVRILSLGQVIKGKRNDTLVIDEKRAAVLREIFMLDREEVTSEE